MDHLEIAFVEEFICYVIATAVSGASGEKLSHFLSSSVRSDHRKSQRGHCEAYLWRLMLFMVNIFSRDNIWGWLFCFCIWFWEAGCRGGQDWVETSVDVFVREEIVGGLCSEGSVLENSRRSWRFQVDRINAHGCLADGDRIQWYWIRLRYFSLV